MTGRDPRERDRTTAPVELLYDLTYVIAFGAAAEELAHQVVEGHVGSGLGAYGFAVFAVTRAWLTSPGSPRRTATTTCSSAWRRSCRWSAWSS